MKLNKNKYYFSKIVLLLTLLLILDIIFINLTYDLFNNQIKIIQNKPIKIKYLGFIITYSIMIFGFYHFIIKDNKSTFDGLIYGFVVYGIYEFTNYTLFNNWDYKTIIVDVMWGTLLHGLLTYVNNNLLN